MRQAVYTYNAFAGLCLLHHLSAYVSCDTSNPMCDVGVRRCFILCAYPCTVRNARSGPRYVPIILSSSLIIYLTSTDACVCFSYSDVMQPPVLRKVILVPVSHAAVQDAVRSRQLGLLLERPSRKCQVSIILVGEDPKPRGNIVDAQILWSTWWSLVSIVLGHRLEHIFISSRCAPEDGDACERQIACRPPLR